MTSQIPSGSTLSARPKPRVGVPVWRMGRPDAFLASAVEQAHAALVDVVDPEQVGTHLAAKSEGERLVTHLFECLRPGYRGWTWYVTMARVSRSKIVTVSELGLLPSEDSVLAPEWVPWAERLRPEDREPAEQQDEADADLADADSAVADESEEGVDGAEAEADEAADAEAAGITDIDDEID
ncbi:DUF3027 domain-containing protein [Sinomonas gamaensis]|uniref:DUF3027 domain-containing protein n=1 Tax=Sinomonas gamaensis TaxID=2565624 RepID=UPI001109A43B|nr:DUF3027 domain-containing protein [Sinomonas gamaensis]